jgi:hypothetical protein
MHGGGFHDVTRAASLEARSGVNDRMNRGYRLEKRIEEMNLTLLRGWRCGSRTFLSSPERNQHIPDIRVRS